jgi:hypothetical protein
MRDQSITLLLLNLLFERRSLGEGAPLIDERCSCEKLTEITIIWKSDIRLI